MPPPKNAPWTPTYEPQQTISSPDNLGGFTHTPINIFYFATKETADHLLAKYQAAYVALVPFEGAAATAPGTVLERVLVWPNGVAINAGLLASLWTLNAGTPDTADRLVRDAIMARGAQ